MDNFIKFLKNIIAKNKGLFLQSLIWVFVLIGFQAFLPILMKWIIVEVSVKQSFVFLIMFIIIYALFLLIYNF